MLKFVIAITLLLFVYCASAAIEEVVVKKSYSGHRVFRCIPDSQSQLEKLRATELDFWLEPRKIGTPVDIATTRDNLLDVQKIFDSIGLKCSVMIEDVQEVMDAEAQNLTNKDTPFLQNYHEWTEIHAYIHSLVCPICIFFFWSFCVSQMDVMLGCQFPQFGKDFCCWKDIPRKRHQGHYYFDQSFCWQTCHVV